MKRDIKSDESSDSDIIIEKIVWRHEIYERKDVELQILSESLKQLKMEDWETDINW